MQLQPVAPLGRHGQADDAARACVTIKLTWAAEQCSAAMITSPSFSRSLVVDEDDRAGRP